MVVPIESTYPLSFRATDAKLLGDHLKHHHSVVVVGMKRVGISNFLRFFLSHAQTTHTYIKNGPLLFVPIDLNNLVELGMYPFWTLTLKRLIDQVEVSTLPESLKAKTAHLFAESIQLHDVFYTLEAVQRVVSLVAQHGMTTILMFIRFDRFAPAITPSLFANLQSLKDAGGEQLLYLFTSHRSLSDIAPDVFSTASLSAFVRTMYLTPASDEDMRSILKSFAARYELALNTDAQKALLAFTAGHVQFLHVALMKIKAVGVIPKKLDDLMTLLVDDEEVVSLCEEIVTSLTSEEQDALRAVAHGEIRKLQDVPSYLVDTGMVVGKKPEVFHPVLATFFLTERKSTKTSFEFTKKEQLLFDVLEGHLDELVERSDIAELVWPDQIEVGVTDWAIDRLVARLRKKMKKRSLPYTLSTVVSRGYKLVKHDRE